MTDILLRPIVRLQVAVAELREREDGQTTTEYAILLGFLAIAIIVALFFLRDVLRELFSEAASSVQNAPVHLLVRKPGLTVEGRSLRVRAPARLRPGRCSRSGVALCS